MKYSVLILAVLMLASGCTRGVTSEMAERVALYKDEAAVPERCEELGEVTASVCANTTPCPEEVMKKNIRERAYIEYDADAVWLYNTTLSGTEVVGYGRVYQCN